MSEIIPFKTFLTSSIFLQELAPNKNLQLVLDDSVVGDITESVGVVDLDTGGT